MANPIEVEHFTSILYDLLDETFARVHGIYLDKGTSLFETLATITAEEASHPVGGKCATLAAQVEHVRYYLDVLEGHLLKQAMEKADWGKIWRTVHSVTPAEWEASKERLNATYHRVRSAMQNLAWDEDEIGAALAIVVHTAYHLGEIRQALCVLKRDL